MKCIQARAPTRIDLAGGTLDLWPLYAFHKNFFLIKTFLETEYLPAGKFLLAQVFTHSAMFQKSFNSTKFI
jgi:hypothetical protein